MTAVIFTGPTIAPEEARAELDALYLPPVSQGDVYRAARRGPIAIGIVDGYFERVPAVWHKEILWAMKEGIHVFGSASMGALRAAELAPFGMEGVGVIFGAFRDGVLEDDDEVAVAHGAAEVRYRGRSEAMVNIRATLARAAQAGVIATSTRAALERIAKGLYYPDRCYPSILRLGAERALPEAELRSLHRWLPAGRVDQKREDALAMLRLIRGRLAAGLEPKRVTYAFEHTLFWERARSAVWQTDQDAAESVDSMAMLDELRLEGSYTAARQGALARVLAVEEARRRGMRASPDVLRETAAAFRRERGLLTSRAARRWLEENGLSDEKARLFMEEEALYRWTKRRIAAATARQLPNQLRSSGDFARLYRRALDKQRVLERRGLESPTLEDVGLSEEALFRWYFKQHPGRPPQEDIARYAEEAGFGDSNAFKRAVLKEYCYVTGKERAGY